MTIKHLKIFITVVECKTMRGAAEKLFISQPSITQAIQEIERHYNTKLFDRLNQRLYLTESGKDFLPHARHVVDAYEALDSRMLKKGQHETLRVGGSVSVGTYLLSDLIDRTESIIPELDFNIVIDNTAKIEEMVINSKLDVAVVEGLVTSSQLIKTPICDDELIIIVGRNHHLYNKEQIEIKDLEKEIWISREEGSISRNQFEQIFIDNNFDIERKWICSNTESIKNIVSFGKGLAVMSKHLVKNELKDKTLRALDVKDTYITRKIHLIYHKDKFLGPSLQSFIDVCKKIDSK